MSRQRLTFVWFRCDKEMKLNPYGFNLNFDEFFCASRPEGVAFGVLGLSGVDASKSCAGIEFGERRDARECGVFNGFGGVRPLISGPAIRSAATQHTFPGHHVFPNALPKHTLEASTPAEAKTRKATPRLAWRHTNHFSPLTSHTSRLSPGCRIATLALPSARWANSFGSPNSGGHVP
jgi:hypothetical protein